MKPEGNIITTTRRRFTEDFQTETVRLVRDAAKPVAQVARELGMADPRLPVSLGGQEC